MNVPEFGLLRLEQIIGRPEITAAQAEENKRRGRRPWRARPAVPALIPIGKSAWELGIREGKFPAGRRIGRVRFWTVAEIRDLIENAPRVILSAPQPKPRGVPVLEQEDA